jgi:hypothetical protein
MESACDALSRGMGSDVPPFGLSAGGVDPQGREIPHLRLTAPTFLHAVEIASTRAQLSLGSMRRLQLDKVTFLIVSLLK